jgi:Flp pilus assembly protein TadD
MDAVRVFISYSHKDDDLREKLQAHLSQLKRDGLVAAWDDRQIPAGTGWADEIDSRLEAADVVLLLVSADFIDSEFCYGKEMKRALERHKDEEDRAIVIPVILRKCDWHSAPFAQFQGLPRDGKPMSDPAWRTEDDYFEAVATGLRRRIQQLIPQQTSAAQAPVVRPRERKWWERPGVRWVLLAALLLVGVASGWWKWKSSAADREVCASVTAMRQGRYRDARDILEKLSQGWIGRTRGAWALAKARLGVSLESEGNEIPVEQFAAGVGQLFKQHPRDPDVLLFRGALALRNGDYAAATETFEQALKVEPEFPEARYYLGSLLLQRGRYGEALPHLNEAVKLAPDAPHYLNARAYARRMTGDTNGAEQDYGLSAANGSILSRLELGQLLWCGGKFQEAAAQQEEALKELQSKSSSLNGRNALPWTFPTGAGETVTLTELREKVCFARLSLFASEFVLRKSVSPGTQDCGPNENSIVRAIVRSVQQSPGSELCKPFGADAAKLENTLLALRAGTTR